MSHEHRPLPSCDVATASARASSVDEDAAPLIVDVRERDEFATLRVPGSVLMPLSGFADSFESLPRDRPLLIMCAAGSRSLVATDHLMRHGFGDVTNVLGGITAWRAAGLPVRSGFPEPGEGDLPSA